MVSFLRGYLNEGGVRVWSERNKLEKLVMENYSDENFLEVKAKHSPDEVLQRWRYLCSVVKNPKRRFRHTANLSKSGEAAAMQRTNQEKLRIAVLVSKAAFNLSKVCLSATILSLRKSKLQVFRFVLMNWDPLSKAMM